MHMLAPPTSSHAQPVASLTAPAWMAALCPPPSEAIAASPFDLRLTLGSGPLQGAGASFSRTWARVKNARFLSAADTEDQVEALYAEMLATMATTCTPRAVRFWNGLPSITEHIPPPTEGRVNWGGDPLQHEKFDRYMAFNFGRFRAFLAHFGSAEAIGREVPAATAVGHGGPDLIVHGLFSATPGATVENPRQTPAWRYSPRFGPLPPCFARATRIEPAGRSTMLISGTASIVGEGTLHPGKTADHLRLQAKETFRNLAALLEADGLALNDLHDARAYVAYSRDFAQVQQLCRTHLTGLRQLELVHAEICRPGLILEVEGIATQ
jgi:chorismate lyase/3-hydroxybenzoate synthase